MRKRKIWPILLIVLVAALLAFLLLREVFVVRDVQVEGNASYSDEQVMRTARIGFGNPILFLDEEAVRSRIDATGALCMEEMRISLPSTVYLKVRERQPMAMVLHQGMIRVLDAQGYVVSSADEVPNMDLVYVSGMKVMDFTLGQPIRSDGGQLEAYCAVMQALSAQGAGAYVSELELENIQQLLLITRTGITVELGDSTDMENKIAWMKSAVQDLENRGEGGGTLDVSSGSKADYDRNARNH